MKQLTKLCLLIGCLVLFLGLPLVYAAIPYGATLTPVANKTAAADVAGSHAAIAGNITEITVTGFSTTQTWQGYYGNVSGTIQLADGSDNVMYNWTLASPQGEVYSAVFGNITWINISCFNFSAAGTYASDVAQIGGTSFYGMNLTQLEAMYNIVWDDMDGVNETFEYNGTNLVNNVGSHDTFYTNSLLFSEGECLSTNTLVKASGIGIDNSFEEVLLYDSENRIPIFVALLDEEDPNGFDDAEHDFQMLVLEDGHGTDTASVTYYFYVELE